MKDALIDSKPASAEDCVKWARLLFQVRSPSLFVWLHGTIAVPLHFLPKPLMAEVEITSSLRLEK